MSDAASCTSAVRPVDPDFSEFRATRDRDVRNRLIERHLGIAHHLARRYRHRGVADDDLVQVAVIGLLKAVERFDPERGTSFASFATPTILGELRRYFRDSTWAVRVPRQLQEHVLAISAAVGPLSQRLARSPSPKEIANETGLTEEQVLEALEADGAYGTTSLDPAAESGGRIDTTMRLADDPETRAEQLVERRLLASALVATLSDRERNIVELRFGQGWTQSQIAEHVGVSQMQVSRLLTRALATMRAKASDTAAPS
ncbi:MAG TPA: SigB/SigF/SigG family RNA polymerase sigma factor [Acidimicrobiia bacterium]|jgi:RNA polymerase sigma-B factor|nr:SigB/SigF/SigG family RNA polymerase sigma factor [Acidimicrobiia bacterium]